MLTPAEVSWVYDKLAASECAALKLQYLSNTQAAPRGALVGRVAPSLAGDGAGREAAEAVLAAWLRAGEWASRCEAAVAAGRLIALDARTTWECVGPAFATALRGPVDGWNEQQAVKLAHELLCVREAAPGAAEAARRDGTAHDDAEAIYAYAATLSPTAAAAAGSALASSGAPAPPPHAVTAVEGTCVGVVPMAEGDDHSEGALVCARPAPAFAPLLTVPRDQLFYRAGAETHSVVGRAAAASAALRAALADEEAFLVLALLFERFVVGEGRSHYAALLRRLPAGYPTVPGGWAPAELLALDGLDALDEVLAKRAQLSRFRAQALALLPALAAALPAPYAGTTAAALAEVFSEERLWWARATFDSRAFVLRIDGADALALVPLADMINHQNRSDVAARRVEGGGGPFVLLGAAALTEADVGRELWMSYGPLQNWELLLHYGFVLPDNEHDKLPFPLAGAAEEDEGEASDDGGWAARRARLVRAYGLDAGGGCWVAAGGVPCAALLALLRVSLAQAEEFPAMEQHGPFVPLSPTTEAAVRDAVAGTVAGVLGLFGTTLEEDLEALAEVEGGGGGGSSSSSSCAGDGEEEKEEEEEEEEEDPHANDNYILCLKLRIGLKQIAARTLAWCETWDPTAQ